jgi:predicted HTH transcriptional regulator
MNQGNAVAILVGVHEKAIIDFKKQYDLNDLDRNDKRFEIAKDIAAFANHLGGTIVVGVVENKQTGKIGAFNSVQDEKRLVQALDEALRFCLPVPVATHEQIDLDAQAQNTLLGRPGATGRAHPSNMADA